ncbi:hypothetical protein Acsp06_43670 [Actinomycetospora sp. NBRC 106375]|uniref:protein kinase domain-containing protein n=1 Tax=Actinomycetospora sp. NBRC 106375 TaxID=3032207 RepID=UPI0024A0135C|nr:protein kinase [Actinomycetospora sp. NBRC 106375]GLZ48182.1 hypothetical protein Acsp06_43670 [Actinomycetospora sp. NBRC 106375]
MVAVGERFGRYRLDALLGRGSSGEVWRAVDTSLNDRTVALKVLREELTADDEFRARFAREAEIACRLNEPHVVPTHTYGEIDGRLFIEMQLVDGVDLEKAIAGRGLTPEMSVSVVEQVAAALGAAHSAGLLHRNVKPANIMLAHARGGGLSGFAYLIDFGLGHGVGHRDDQTVGYFAAKLYIAPEEVQDRPVDHRADIYELTCVLYECLSGCRPFRGEAALDVVRAHLDAPPPRPSDTSPALRAFDQVIARGMAKTPEGRFRSAHDVASAARSALRAPTAAVFISYRRSDTDRAAERLDNLLRQRLGDPQVFLDVRSIRPGAEFRDDLRNAIARSAVMLVMIGRGWLRAGRRGRRRLDDPADLVRIEIEHGLRARLLVIPVLVDGAAMPRADALPEALAPLASRNACRLGGQSFDDDTADLVDYLNGYLASIAARAAGVTPSTMEAWGQPRA